MGTPDTILLLCILVTQVVWAVTSPFSPIESIKTLLRNKAGLGSFLSLFLIIQVLHLFDIYFLDTVPSWLVILGIALTICGMILACWAKFTMKHIWGIPAQHNINRQNKLVTTGPFAISRNPIYVGLLMILVGTELTLGSIFVLLTLPLILIIYQAVIKEESLLEKYFKKEYGIYKKRTPRYLFRI